MAATSAKSALDKVSQAMAAQSGASKSALDKVGQAMATAKMNKMALTKERARADFLEVTAPMRSKVMGSMKASIKAGVLADPDMWQCVRRLVNAVLDNLLDDVEKEIERNLHTALLQQQEDADAPGPKGSLFTCCWYRLRAFILYHYLPHDKYFFGKLKDPVYVLMYVVTLLPIHGLRIAMFAVILLFLIFPGRPDEFQLINFILLCKGMQFMTSGLVQMAAGATKYFACYTIAKGDFLECVDNYGPGARDGVGLAMDYLGSISLVWVAWLLLTRSEKHGQDKSHADETMEEAEKRREAGGRLRSLLMYDMRCFFGSLCLLLVLTVLTCWPHFEPGGDQLRGVMRDPQFQANIFWCCVGYSIFSFPFAPFMIPGLQEVMTHCYATGFNRNGACVSFDMPSAEDEGANAGGSYNTYFTFLATNTTNIVNTINRGRALRGAQGGDVTEYKFGDFTRGIYAQITGHGQPPSPANSSSAPSFWNGQEVASVISKLVPGGDVVRAKSKPASDDVRTRSKTGSGLLEEPARDQFSALSGLLSGAATPCGSQQGEPTPEMPDEEPLCLENVAAVELPKDGMVEVEGVCQFCLVVVPEGSLDAENGLEAWQVMRRYTDFEKLAGKLGKQCYNYTSAPFPKKTWTACTGEKLEQRRLGLKVWLNHMLQEQNNQEGWGRPLHEFLTVEVYSDPEETKTIFTEVLTTGSKARGGPGNYQFGDFTRGLISMMTKPGTASGSGAPDQSGEGTPQDTSPGQPPPSPRGPRSPSFSFVPLSPPKALSAADGDLGTSSMGLDAPDPEDEEAPDGAEPEAERFVPAPIITIVPPQESSSQPSSPSLKSVNPAL